LSHIGLLGTITWDPFIRGVLIVTVAFLLLPGSVYLVLSTDLGARVGFLVAAAGITGWVFVMALIWATFGIGDVGRPNSWKPVAVITGDFAGQNTIPGVQSFPAGNPPQNFGPASCHDPVGWRKIPSTLLSDPAAAGDSVLAPPASTSGATPKFASPFSSTSDYVVVDAYTKGENSGCFFQWRRHKFYMPLGRQPHYVVVRVQPALPTLATGGAPATPQPDPTKPYTYVVIERNLGSVREPPLVIAAASFILFAIITYTLHRRDKESWAAKAAEEAQAGQEREPARV
jgi:hypothetical protein